MTLSSVITGCGGNADDLLAQVDERPHAVDERHDDRQARLQRAAVAPEALDDAGAGLRDDADGPRGHEEREEHQDHDDDQASHATPLLVHPSTSAVAPRISMTWTRGRPPR